MDVLSHRRPVLWFVSPSLTFLYQTYSATPLVPGRLVLLPIYVINCAYRTQEKLMVIWVPMRDFPG
jgi:hypothetical protein